MDGTMMIGIGAGLCTAVSLLPQLVKMLREKKANDISLFYLFILLVGLILWIVYGIKKDDLPVTLTNVAALVLNIMIILFGIRYKSQNNNH